MSDKTKKPKKPGRLTNRRTLELLGEAIGTDLVAMANDREIGVKGYLYRTGASSVQRWLAAGVRCRLKDRGRELSCSNLALFDGFNWAALARNEGFRNWSVVGSVHNLMRSCLTEAELSVVLPAIRDMVMEEKLSNV